MKTIKSNEFIILRIPPLKENIYFVYQTFAITQYIFYDDRFLTSYLKDEHPDKFNKEYYNEFREKCLDISNDKEISFTLNEFFFLAKIIDFVSKCFIGDPNAKLKEIMENDFNENPDFDYNFHRDNYLKKAAKLFKDFRKSCENKEILEKLSDKLNWNIDI